MSRYIKFCMTMFKSMSVSLLVHISNNRLCFIQANDAYLQMAIGNAPWPIGVTMVGIHARTGREKIFSKHVAHVLNDETQRKYIQVRHELNYCFNIRTSKYTNLIICLCLMTMIMLCWSGDVIHMHTSHMFLLCINKQIS